jgi:hypothetical protein
MTIDAVHDKHVLVAAHLAIRRAAGTRQTSSNPKDSPCGKPTLSSPRPPSSPGWGSDALWKAGHRHPPSAFPQGLENPSGVSHSSPPPTTTKEITPSALDFL